MCKQSYSIGVLLTTAILCVSSASVLAAITKCDPTNPNANTLMLQAAIDIADPGSTLELPSGVCVVAKCDLTLPPGQFCPGVRHFSALHIGNKKNLTLVGAPDGTSVLKLDPNPPGSPGHHAYCGDTHVLSIHLSQFITLRDFTVDGSDGELPHDKNQCPPNPKLGTHSGLIDEHLHDVHVLNATDITINHMKLIEAHGDGLNLAAERSQPMIPNTERISVTNTDFLANDRSGITFQRNVGFVSIVGNYFRNSGNDQDLDMEPTGGPDDLGSYEVNIDNNLFERLQPKIAVSLGATGPMHPSRGIRFTHNTIRASPLAKPATKEGGCIRVNAADQTTIADHTVIGAQGCVTVFAQRVTDLVIEQNHLESFANAQTRTGKFSAQAVIDVSERIVNLCTNCGDLCPFFIHYPERITVKGNTIIQHVRNSLGVRLSNADSSVVTDNIIEATDKIASVGTVDPSVRAIGIDVPFGVLTLRSGYYLNEQTAFKGWSISGNQLSQFADGIKTGPIKVGLGVSSTVLTTNVFNTNLTAPRGIYLEGAASAPQVGFVSALVVDKNCFGSGFDEGLPPNVLPPYAYVRPSGQAHTGNIGVLMPCFQLTVNKILVHPDHNQLRLFNLKIDGVTVRANVNAGSTGPQLVSPGNHTVSETGGTGTPLSAFGTVIGGDCAANGTVNLVPGDNKTCTITNYDNFGGCSSGSICCEPGAGTQGCLQCSHGCP